MEILEKENNELKKKMNYLKMNQKRIKRKLKKESMAKSYYTDTKKKTQFF